MLRQSVDFVVLSHLFTEDQASNMGNHLQAILRQVHLSQAVQLFKAIGELLDLVEGQVEDRQFPELAEFFRDLDQLVVGGVQFAEAELKFADLRRKGPKTIVGQ